MAKPNRSIKKKPEKSLIKFRKQMDMIDKDLRRLILRRLNLTNRIQKYKRANGLKAKDPAREQQILHRQTRRLNAAQGRVVRSIYRVLFGVRN